MLRRERGNETAETLDRVAGDDEIRTHALRSLQESIAVVRRARALQQRERGTGRRVVTILGVVGVLGGIAWFFRRRSDNASGGFHEPYRRSDPSSFESTPSVVGRTSWDEPTDSTRAASHEANVEATADRPSRTTGVSVEEWEARRGSEVIDAAGEHVGRMQATYFDVDTGLPEWALVSFGSVRPSLRFVPVRTARLEPDGVHLNISGELMHAAPEIDADGQISEEEESALYAHYGVERVGDVGFSRKA